MFWVCSSSPSRVKQKVRSSDRAPRRRESGEISSERAVARPELRVALPDSSINTRRPLIDARPIGVWSAFNAQSPSFPGRAFRSQCTFQTHTPFGTVTSSVGSALSGRPLEVRVMRPRKARRSLQLGVFRLGLLEDRDVGVGVFPEGEEILVSSLCLALISRQSERSA